MKKTTNLPSASANETQRGSNRLIPRYDHSSQRMMLLEQVGMAILALCLWLAIS